MKSIIIKTINLQFIHNYKQCWTDINRNYLTKMLCLVCHSMKIKKMFGYGITYGERKRLLL